MATSDVRGVRSSARWSRSLAARARAALISRVGRANLWWSVRGSSQFLANEKPAPRTPQPMAVGPLGALQRSRAVIAPGGVPSPSQEGKKWLAVWRRHRGSMKPRGISPEARGEQACLVEPAPKGIVDVPAPLAALGTPRSLASEGRESGFPNAQARSSMAGSICSTPAQAIVWDLILRQLRSRSRRPKRPSRS